MFRIPTSASGSRLAAVAQVAEWNAEELEALANLDTRKKSTEMKRLLHNRMADEAEQHRLAPIFAANGVGKLLCQKQKRRG